MGDGDGWVICSLGHRHWGLYGAAGLLITDGDRSVLQHRAPWTHEGDTWALVGGARDSHEDVVSAALREALEEAAVDSSAVSPVGLLIDDHGGWSYTSIMAGPLLPIYPHAANAESSDIRWWTNPEIEALPLHRGFAGMWPRLRSVPPRLTVLIDANTGPGAGLGSLDIMAVHQHAHQVARCGVRTSDLPFDSSTVELDVLLPSITLLVTDPESYRDEFDDGPQYAWWRRAVRVARRPAPDESLASALPAGPAQVLAVGFQDLPRLAGATYVTPDWWLGLPVD